MKRTIRKKYLKQIAIQWGAMLLSVFFLLYLFYHISGGFRAEPKTQVAVYAEGEETIYMTGYLFREEIPVYVGAQGELFHLASHNTKVTKDAPLAESYPYGTDLTALYRSRALQERIAVLEEAGAMAQLITAPERTDALLYDDLMALTSAVRLGMYGQAIDGSHALLVNLARKELIRNSKKNFSEELTLLRAEEESLLQSVPNGTVYTAPADGYFSQTTDGWGSLFSPEKLSHLTPDTFRTLLETYTQASAPDRADVGVILPTAEWHLLCPFSGDAALLTVGDVYTLHFPENPAHSISFTLTQKISDPAGEETLLCFTTDRFPADFDYLRAQTVEIRTSAVSGLKVPLSALRSDGTHTFVYILHGTSIYRRQAQIDYISGDHAYISVDTPAWEAEDGTVYLPLQQNDLVVTDRALYHGKILH